LAAERDDTKRKVPWSSENRTTEYGLWGFEHLDVSTPLKDGPNSRFKFPTAPAQQNVRDPHQVRNKCAASPNKCAHRVYSTHTEGRYRNPKVRNRSTMTSRPGG
jgi:hypothetical protein